MHDTRLGLTTGLSNESAIPSLKHTDQYNADRNTPAVHAFIFDLYKASDLVNYGW